MAESDVRVCDACQQDGGLCSGCAAHDKSILPQLAQLRYALMGKKRLPSLPTLADAPPPLNTPGRKLARMQRALNGERIRNRRVA